MAKRRIVRVTVEIETDRPISEFMDPRVIEFARKPKDPAQLRGIGFAIRNPDATKLLDSATCMGSILRTTAAVDI